MKPIKQEAELLHHCPTLLRQSQHIAHTGSECGLLLLQPCEHWNLRHTHHAHHDQQCFSLKWFLLKMITFYYIQSKNHLRGHRQFWKCYEALYSYSFRNKASVLTVVNKKVLWLILFSVSLWKMIKELRMGYLDSVSYLYSESECDQRTIPCYFSS